MACSGDVPLGRGLACERLHARGAARAAARERCAPRARARRPRARPTARRRTGRPVRSRQASDGLNTGGEPAARCSRSAASPMRSQASALDGARVGALGDLEQPRRALRARRCASARRRLRLAGSSARLRTASAGRRRKTCTLETRPSPAMQGPSRKVAPGRRKSSIELTSATSSEPSASPRARRAGTRARELDARLLGEPLVERPADEVGDGSDAQRRRRDRARHREAAESIIAACGPPSSSPAPSRGTRCSIPARARSSSASATSCWRGPIRRRSGGAGSMRRPGGAPTSSSCASPTAAGAGSRAQARTGASWPLAVRRARASSCARRPSSTSASSPSRRRTGAGRRALRAAGAPARVLNLFGYTGVASLLARRAGAEVTHVDASRQALAWARENAALSGLGAGRPALGARRRARVRAPRGAPRRALPRAS